MKLYKPNFWEGTQFSVWPYILLPFSIVYNFIYYLKSKLAKEEKFNVPIICVGNIYLGGTGKTPLCIEIFKILKLLNLKPAFVKKKYKKFLDEEKMLEIVGKVFSKRKRGEAIKLLISNNANVAILDDGLQDYSINKSLSIICFTEKQWIGNGRVIPAGPLREKISALKRADCAFINGKKNIDIENKIFSQNKEIKIFYTKYKPENINEFKNKKAIAFAGIGNPINFFNLLKNNNVNVVNEIQFPDHHNFSENELKDLINIGREKGAILLTTEKDFFRINKNYKENINYLKITVEIENRNQFIDEIKKII